MDVSPTHRALTRIWPKLFANLLWRRRAFPFRLGPQDKVLEDIRRIALTSPHLLPDLGFSYDPHASNPIAAGWRKGDILVLVQRTERHVAVSRDG